MPSFEKDLPSSNANSALTDAQFQELCRLLQPGFELSTLMLADYELQRETLSGSGDK